MYAASFRTVLNLQPTETQGFFSGIKGCDNCLEGQVGTQDTFLDRSEKSTVALVRFSQSAQLRVYVNRLHGNVHRTS